MAERTHDTLILKNGTKLSGYPGEYIFERLRASGAFYEQALLDLWRPNIPSGGVVFDIGANIGNHTVYFATEAAAAQVYAFEPMPVNFAMLEQNIKNNGLQNAQAFNMALGDREGVAIMRFNVEGNNGTSSVDDGLLVADADTTEVRMARMDDLSLPAPDFIKIDVEGYEYHVLQGMAAILETAKPMLWIEVDEKNAQLVYDFLKKYGYGIKELQTEAGNNILFTYRCEDMLPASQTFAALLHETSLRQDIWIQLGNQKSKLEYEQSHTQSQKLELENRTSQLLYEQTRVQTLQAEKRQLDAEKRQLDAEKRQLNKALAEEQHALLDCKAQLEQKDREIKALQDEVYFWKQNIFKRNGYLLAKWLYRKCQPYPRIMRLFEWINDRLHLIKNVNGLRGGQGRVVASSFGAQRAADGLKPLHELNVAMIVDEFSYNSLKYECNALPLEPEDWQFLHVIYCFLFREEQGIHF